MPTALLTCYSSALLFHRVSFSLALSSSSSPCEARSPSSRWRNLRRLFPNPSSSPSPNPGPSHSHSFLGGKTCYGFSCLQRKCCGCGGGGDCHGGITRCWMSPGVGGGVWEGADGSSGEAAMNDCLDPGKGNPPKEDTSMLFNLVQDIEPLDISRISKDASSESTDAMKRTISGMLGLLPSDRFSVTVEALPQPLARLLVSSFMTGYTLKNAEYRLCLQRSLDRTGATYEVNGEISKNDLDHTLTSTSEHQINDGTWFGDTNDEATQTDANQVVDKDLEIPSDLGSITPQAFEYIKYLEARLSSTLKDLERRKKRYTGIDMNRVVGEEKNELLDFLRSLEEEKVAELSRPSSLEVEQVIQKIVTRTIEKMQLSSIQRMKLEHSVEVPSSLLVQDGVGLEDDSHQHLLPPVSCSRDYLARLLFWCMLLGYYIRGLEYRLELSRTLHLSGEID